MDVEPSYETTLFGGTIYDKKVSNVCIYTLTSNLHQES